MNTKTIIKDVLKYPLLDWKKILILGVILVVSNSANIIQTFLDNVGVMVISLGLIGFVARFLANGYKFKILESSFNGVKEPPEFNNWSEMFTNGIKLFIVGFIYTIPAILLVFTIIPLKSGIELIIGVMSFSTFSTYPGAKWFLGILALLYFIIIKLQTGN